MMLLKQKFGVQKPKIILIMLFFDVLQVLIDEISTF